MSVKYLGVFLNDSLSWDTHLNTSQNLTEPLVFLLKYDIIRQNISSKQYIIHFLSHT